MSATPATSLFEESHAFIDPYYANTFADIENNAPYMADHVIIELCLQQAWRSRGYYTLGQSGFSLSFTNNQGLNDHWRNWQHLNHQDGEPLPKLSPSATISSCEDEHGPAFTLELAKDKYDYSYHVVSLHYGGIAIKESELYAHPLLRRAAIRTYLNLKQILEHPDQLDETDSLNSAPTETEDDMEPELSARFHNLVLASAKPNVRGVRCPKRSRRLSRRAADLAAQECGY